MKYMRQSCNAANVLCIKKERNREIKKNSHPEPGIPEHTTLYICWFGFPFPTVTRPNPPTTKNTATLLLYCTPW